MKILVIDVGGTNVKLFRGKETKRKFDSGRSMTPKRFVAEVKKLTGDWEFDRISIGFPAPVMDGRPAVEPNNLGKGWKGFDFEKAFGKPTKLMNDAAMQALGSYERGRMLFLGLGTGLGSALIVDSVVIPLELGELAYSRERTLEDMLGKEGLKRLGLKRWRATVNEVVALLRKAFFAECVVLGGGNAKKLGRLPKGALTGHNDNAYVGGIRLWRRSRGGVRSKTHTLEIQSK